MIILNFCLSTMMFMFNATITLRIDELNYNPSASGALIAVGAVAATIYSFFGGRIADQLGRKRLIAAGLLLFGLMTGAMGFAKSLIPLFPLRIVQMAGYSIATTTMSIAVVDIVPNQRIGEGVGYSSLAQSAAQAVGPGFALALYSFQNGFQLVTGTVTLIGAVGAVLSITILNYEKANGRKGENTSPKDQRNRNNRQDSSAKGIWKFIEPKALPASFVNLLLMLGGSVITIYLTLFTSKTGIKNPGMFFTLNVIFLVSARVFFGKLSDKRGTLAAVIPGILAQVISYAFLIASQKTEVLFFVAAVFNGFGVGIATPAVNAGAVRGVPDRRKSVASATFFLFINIAFVAGPIIWGKLIEGVGFTAVFEIAITMFILALVLSVFLLREKKGMVNQNGNYLSK